jgi:hypothetical protein
MKACQQKKNLVKENSSFSTSASYTSRQTPERNCVGYELMKFLQQE